MTHQILTRFFVASLIILGEGVFTCEVNSRSDVSVAAIGNTVQSLPSAFLDDPEDGAQLIPALPYSTPASSPLTDNVLDTPAYLATEANKYSPSKPRAPPVAV